MADPALDGFQAHFEEKLWEMIPPLYRHEDGIAELPGQLRALVEVMAQQATLLRQSQDRLWDDQYVDLCADWCLPYLADLVATRLLSEANPRGRRVDVAKTVYYRRRKGTPRILTELTSDIAQWEGVVVEQFRRLARQPHLLDPDPQPRAGRSTGTLPGGIADLRRASAAAQSGSPFDEFHYTPDVRRHRGTDGLYGVPKLAFHLYRLGAYTVVNAQAQPGSNAKRFFVDPAERRSPLFAPRQLRLATTDWTQWRSPQPWELPAPLTCPLLNHAEFLIDDELVSLVAGFTPALPPATLQGFARLVGMQIPSESRLKETLHSLPNGQQLTGGAPGNARYDEIRSRALVADCGRKRLIPRAIRVVTDFDDEIASHEIVAGNLSTWADPPEDKRLMIDPELGRLHFRGANPGNVHIDFHYGFSDDIGAGTYPRSGLPAPDFSISGGGLITGAQLDGAARTEIQDNLIYESLPDKTGISDLALQVRNGVRPFLALHSNWVLNTGSNADARLELDGLWIGGPHEIILRNTQPKGSYAEVIIRRCTLDPGERSGGVVSTEPTALIIETHVDRLVIDRSITGPIRVRGAGVVERIEIVDSIIQSVRPATTAALDLPASEAEIDRTTLLGDVNLLRLRASEILATGTVSVLNTQDGCFRFSAAGVGSTLPHPYESHKIEGAAALFTSTRFLDPGFAQLSEAAPEFIRRGAESGSEIGAFSRIVNPIKLDDLGTKVEEYMPFGIVPLFIPAT